MRTDMITGMTQRLSILIRQQQEEYNLVPKPPGTSRTWNNLVMTMLMKKSLKLKMSSTLILNLSQDQVSTPL